MEIQKANQNQQLVLATSTQSLLVLLMQNNKIELFKVQSVITLELAVQGSQLSTIKKQDEAQMLIAVKNLVLSVAESLNLTQTINETQTLEIVFLIAEKYWSLKLEELVLIFKKAKMGDYGKTFNRLDVQIVFEWIEAYLRSEERAIHFEKKNTGFKSDPIPKEIMKKAYENYKIEKKPEPDSKEERYQIERAEYFRQKQIKEYGLQTNPGTDPGSTTGDTNPT